MTFPQALISEKSALLMPSIRILLRESAVLPVFVRVTVWAAATEPTAGLANINLLGEKFATGPGPMPAPVRGMTCGLLERIIGDDERAIFELPDLPGRTPD